ncbi:alpha-L-rhamnosidase [Abditibacterium utsteinense]|uniref:Alpha-L-rhamnosidase n=1 Tax=Abditibacterium utsteinense TaxID=1960156 RepID=A0A2S8STW1_9BACT|nr:family 78 glycoside hydrolase catalytic domain [Abditibacterium utsteinense]PQV64216.1 alpha-L-rhamnosidase [Abditibacterium utsteinense]
MKNTLALAPIDARTRRFLPATRVLWSHSTKNEGKLLENNWGQALADDVPSCQLNGEGAGVLLDFGRELHGNVQFVVGPIAGNRSVRARLRFGESASEAMGEPNNDHANHDFEIRLAPMSSGEFGLTGFRFARLDLLENAEVPLVAARAVTLEHEPKEIGSFQCSDERLNQIWRVGRETTRLCLQDYIWDGIKRDRLVWMGDLHPEIAVVLKCYGALEIVPQSLDWVRNHTALPAWMNGIGSYSMWWVVLQRDWWMQTADLTYLQSQRAYLLGLLPLLMEQIGENGEISWRGSTFMDWPSSPNQSAVLSGLHALLCWSLESGATLCDALGEGETATKCRHNIEVLRRHAPALPPQSEAAHAGTKQAAALLALTHLADAKVANAQVLSQAPLKSLSTFYGFYTLQARALAGDVTGALDVIRKYWGTMIDLGATTFWEHFELEWAENAGRIDELPQPGKRDIHRECGEYCYVGLRHSFCHGWAAGPTAFLSETVLGAQIIEAGGSVVRVRPQLGDLKWAEGDFPTAFGPIHIRHTKNEAGEIESHIEAPPQVRIER